MDNLLQLLTSIQFVGLSLALIAITYVARVIGEYVLDSPKVPMTKYSKFWTKLVLPILPIILGGVYYFVAPSLSYPDVIKSVADKVCFGLMAGLLSGLEYQVIKGLLEKQLPPEVAAKIKEEADKLSKTDSNV